VPAAAPPTRPVLRERYERRRAAVLRAAARLFAEQGYHATSMDDLSAATGLAPGGLYHYFGSKEELLLGILEQLMDPLLARAQEVASSPGPPSERLRALLHVWIEHIAEHHDHMLVFAQERRVVERGGRWTQVRDSRRAFEAILGRLVADTDPPGDVRLRVLALLGMVNHTANWYRPSGRLSTSEIADGYWQIVAAGGSPGGRSTRPR
jgi:TetR/AcrR family transcriptional regulator, cholesterol catabolism regulator